MTSIKGYRAHTFIFDEPDMDGFFRDTPGLARMAYPEEAVRRGLTPITEESIRAWAEKRRAELEAEGEWP